jgi:hypothetical protein
LPSSQPGRGIDKMLYKNLGRGALAGQFAAALLAVLLSACGGASPDQEVDAADTGGDTGAVSGTEFDTATPEHFVPGNPPPEWDVTTIDPTEEPLPPAASYAWPLLAEEDGMSSSGTKTAMAVSGSCYSLPPLPTKPSNARKVSDFGVYPSDTKDQTIGIQNALNALKAGEWLVFPAGRYRHSKSLKVRVPNVVLWSEGAILHATNPDDQAVMLQAEGVKMFGFRLHAVTDIRRSAAWHARIAIYAATNNTVLRNIVIRRNVIENAGSPGTSLANSASSVGILVYKAENFVVAENTVKRSIADGIHMTGASRYGRVILNNVRENGDDMIAVVSYMGGVDGAATSASSLNTNLSALRAERLNHNILITRNNLSGQWWGRGISVVGGRNITIDNNVVDRPTYAAGIMLARDVAYLSFGVHDIVVRNNTITNVQTSKPLYSMGTAASVPRTRQGGLEIHAQMFSDEKLYSSLTSELAVDRVNFENNSISYTLADAMRIGAGTYSNYTLNTKNSGGAIIKRTVVGGKVGLLGLVSNRMSNLGTQTIAILNQPTTSYNVYCSGNTVSGSATTNGLCMGSRPVATGASLTCS